MLTANMFGYFRGVWIHYGAWHVMCFFFYRPASSCSGVSFFPLETFDSSIRPDLSQKGARFMGRHIGLSGNKQWLRPVAWALAGYGLIHPVVMASTRMMSSADKIIADTVVLAVSEAFSHQMLPWSLGFGVLAGIAGMFSVRLRQAKEQRMKLQAIMELTGAACHELNQPMQVVLGYADLLCAPMAAEDPLRKPLKEIAEQILKMDCILKKLKNISTYETRGYVHGIRIIDIDKSTALPRKDKTPVVGCKSALNRLPAAGR